MVAGEDAQTARVHGQAFGHAELEAEVRHQPEAVVVGVAVRELIPARRVPQAGEIVAQRRGRGHERGVAGELVEPVLGHERQEAKEVVGVATVGVDPAKEVAGALVTSVAEVHGDVAQRRESIRQAGGDAVDVVGAHRGTVPDPLDQ